MANDHDYGRFTMAFRVVCWIATLLVMSYWIFRYSLNQDISRIEYKKYYEKSSDVYPVLSLCLKNSFSKTKLQMTSQVLNETLYRQYLKGDYFSPKFMEVDYDDIRLNLSDFIDKYYFVWRNGSSSMHDFEKEPLKLFLPSFSGFWNAKFYNCYALQTPHDIHLVQFEVLIRSTIFPDGVRSTNYDLLVILHYSNQLLVSYKNLKYAFSRQDAESTYSTRFHVKDVEIMQRRNKNSSPCKEDSQNYDNDILQHHIDYVGCRASYQGNFSSKVPLCSTKEQMAKASMTLRSDGYGDRPPCRTMEKIDYEYSENDITDTIYAKKGSFWLNFSILSPHFKEIKQER